MLRSQFSTDSCGEWLTRALGPEGRDLINSRPLVAVVTLDVPLPPDFPTFLEVNLDASLCFGGSPRRLRLLRVAGDHSTRQAPSVQIMTMYTVIETHLGSKMYKADDGPWMWPLHTPKVQRALALAPFSALTNAGDDQNPRPLWKRALTSVNILRHSQKGQLLTVLKENYGPSVAYLFARTEFFTQKLWLLTPILVIGDAIDANPTKGDDAVIMWQVMKALVLLWGIYSAVDGGSANDIVGSTGATGSTSAAIDLEEHHHQANHLHDKSLDSVGVLSRIVCYGGPLLFAFMFTVVFTIFGVTQLIVFIVYIWGDCVTMGCKDPAIKRGFAGFLAEVGADILLAILLELLHTVGNLIAQKIACLSNHELRRDREFQHEMVAIMLAALDRLGTFSIMAFFFVPQWEQTQGNLEADCSDLLFGNSDLFCLQRRMSTQTRRELFMLMFKGPFMVAPFVGIVVKVIVPFVGRHLDEAAETVHCGCMNRCTDFIPHLLGLILYYDGGHVGGFNYVLHGWQYTDIKPEKPIQDKQDEASLQDAAADEFANLNASEEDLQARTMWALKQGVRKEFEPLSEELELKVSLLWILFFGPMMPIGIVTTLLARLLESHTDMLKMLYVRRRPFPHPHYLMHFTQTTFVRAAVWAAIGWYAGLSLITFNDDLPHWSGALRTTFVVLLVAWFAVAAVLLLLRYGAGNERHQASSSE
eukprot:TRINITY_DN2095_c0_g1_i2.p1 TRINITY_DN2095_c0_g1~~TRINITY_DN2095_c0_g1_i2.p1  ORF type:complete len:701 (-),score=101.57 TRINITY_DN2095_c0_g1_i2:494-2596(-)